MSSKSFEDTLQLERENSPPQQWPQLLAADPAADYFHTDYWTCSVRDHIPGLKAVWLTARSEGSLVGALACLYQSRPAPRWESNIEGTSGGPLIDSSLPDTHYRIVFDKLMAAYVALRGSGLGTTCVTVNHRQEEVFGPWLRGSSIGWKFQETPAAVIPLDGGLEFVEMNLMNKNKRNERNRGLRRGAKVLITHDPELLAAYYPIYENACRKWDVSPSPLPLLQALLADPETIAPGITRTFFTCVMLEGRVIGGHLNLQWGQRVIAWNGVTDPEFARTHFPATLAVWGDIEESCRRGAAILDLGGSGGVVSLEGFKKNFGASSEGRGHYVLDSMGMKILRGGKKLLKNIRSSSDGKGPRRWHDSTPEKKSDS